MLSLADEQSPARPGSRKTHHPGQALCCDERSVADGPDPQLRCHVQVTQPEQPAQPVVDVVRFALAYGQIARALATGEVEDKRLALDIVRLVQAMPPVKTQHEVLVQTLRATRVRKAAQHELERAIPKALGQGRAPDDEQVR